MYIGRVVIIAKSAKGGLSAVYRVSSRSFPNRTAVIGEDKVSIVPKAGHEEDIHKNPYIAYNCVRLVADGAVAVLTNGSQTDPIAEKIQLGMPVRDALAEVSLALDFEKDDYNTPRISAVADRRDDSGWLAIVRHDGLEVRRMPLEAVLRMVLMGGRERITAQRAYEIGLVGEVVPKERLMARARELAQVLLQNSPGTMMATKQAIWESLQYSLGDALEHGRGFVRAHIDHPDWKEGAQAFREKREPRWTPPS